MTAPEREAALIAISRLSSRIVLCTRQDECNRMELELTRLLLSLDTDPRGRVQHT